MNKDVTSYLSFDATAHQLVCRDDWNLTHLTFIKQQLAKIKWPHQGELTIDGRAISKMDSAGALLLTKQIDLLTKKGLSVQLIHFTEEAKRLLSMIEDNAASLAKIPKRKIPNWLAQIGKYNWDLVIELLDYLRFVGVLTFEMLRMILRPDRWRWGALANVIDATGYKALPIIALLSFMIGVVISYQMGNYLRTYGANVFIVNLLGLSILREFGPLITAIMVAGRTGSAFTAELGIMKINQEIDALNTMGVTPAGLLLLPRLIGLFIALPLLTMWADIFGIFGGMLMAKNMLDISYYDFLHRFQHEIPLRSLIIGLGKAPVFALIIASIGCFQGFQVKSSADSLGKLTTRSVVLAIFFIIITDAIFSVIFSKLDL